MPALPQLHHLHEAMQVALWRESRGDEASDRAAAWAAPQLRVMFEVGQEPGLILSFWRACPNGPEQLLRRLEAIIPPSPSERAFYRGYAATLPEDVDLAILHNAAYTLSVSCGDHEGALPLWERALARAPDDPDVLLCAGNSFSALGHVERALASFAEAARRDPESVGPRLNAAQLLRRRGRFAEARDHMAQVVALDGAPEHWHVYGHMLQECGQHAEGADALGEAIAGYGRRLRRGPNAQARFWRGAAHARRGSRRSALDDLAEALRLDPSLRGDALHEEDYAPLHGDPRWKELLEP